MSDTLNLDSIGFRWKGNYNSNSQYNEGDVVRRDGDVYAYSSGTFVPPEKFTGTFRLNPVAIN